MPAKTKIAFPCGRTTQYIPYSPSYAEEFKQGIPVLRKLFLHEKHAHVVKFDVQGGDRGNDIVDVYDDVSRLTSGENVEYVCDKCGQNFKIMVNPKSTPDQKSADLKIPAMSKSYQFVHVHAMGSDKHAAQIRISPQGKVISAKYIEFARSE
jgi:hypothetical protein